jgi:hypothetical protein
VWWPHPTTTATPTAPSTTTTTPTTPTTTRAAVEELVAPLHVRCPRLWALAWQSKEAPHCELVHKVPPIFCNMLLRELRPVPDSAMSAWSVCSLDDAVPDAEEREDATVVAIVLLWPVAHHKQVPRGTEW